MAVYEPRIQARKAQFTIRRRFCCPFSDKSARLSRLGRAGWSVGQCVRPLPMSVTRFQRRPQMHKMHHQGPRGLFSVPMPSFHDPFCGHLPNLPLLLIQGTCATGVWVLAHEAGHGAFSPQAWVNDTVGWIFHSALLVPYFSWKYTHASYVVCPQDSISFRFHSFALFAILCSLKAYI